MSHNLQEQMPKPYDALAVWEQQAPAFLAIIAEFGNDATSELIKAKVGSFRSQLENPTEGEPDYNKFSTECSAIFVQNLPSFQVPKAKILVWAFFRSLLIIAGLIFVIGLTGIMQAKLVAVMGLITITGYHVKGLAITAAYLGGAGGTLMAIGMFSPQLVSTSALNTFTKSVKQPEAESPSATARIPKHHNALAVWDKQIPAFLDGIDEFGHKLTSDLIKNKAASFRSQLENPTENGEPDYNKFSTECSAIFVENLPSFQVPKAKWLVGAFFISLLIIAGLIFAIGLIMIMAAKLAAVMGLITITGYHVKGLATTAAYLGGAGGTLMAIGMFSPQWVASTLTLNSFTTKVKPPEAQSPSAPAIS